MPNANYQRGVRQEREIINYLKSKGWSCIRSAGSKSPVDIIAIKGGKALAIQAKSYRISPSLRNDEINRLIKEGFWGPMFLEPLLLTGDWKEDLERIA